MRRRKSKCPSCGESVSMVRVLTCGCLAALEGDRVIAWPIQVHQVATEKPTKRRKRMRKAVA